MVYNLVFSEHSTIMSKKEIYDYIDKDITKFRKEGDYFKMFKRMFSKNTISGATNHDLQDLINSEYGLMYNVIFSIGTVKQMLEQTFKPVSLDLVKDNIEHIKHELSKIDIFDLLDDL
jgi:hypothetical protein